MKEFSPTLSLAPNLKQLSPVREKVAMFFKSEIDLPNCLVDQILVRIRHGRGRRPLGPYSLPPLPFPGPPLIERSELKVFSRSFVRSLALSFFLAYRILSPAEGGPGRARMGLVPIFRPKEMAHASAAAAISSFSHPEIWLQS